MRQISIFIILLTSLQMFSQDYPDYYQIGGIYAREGEYAKAIENYKMELEREPDDYLAWYYKGLSEAFLDSLENALTDFDKVVELKPDFYDVYFSRAYVNEILTNYAEALIDLDTLVSNTDDFPDAYYHRGIINEYLKNYTQACSDFEKAQALGLERMDNVIEISCDSVRASNYANILFLHKTSDDDTYGLTGENPIKVGTGIHGGPANQRAFLDLLRSPNGNILSYDRRGSCCGYESENGLLGSAMVDLYEVSYIDSKGEEVITEIYISMYDYEDPLIPVGFKTRTGIK